MKRSRVGAMLAEELKWRQEETWFGARVDPQLALGDLAQTLCP